MTRSHGTPAKYTNESCRCEECRLAWSEYNKARHDPKLHRERLLMANYGIDLEGYQDLLDSQGGQCAICGTPPAGQPLQVDHDHDTGEVRGLLCRNCNLGLGHFQDELSRLRSASAYLERFTL